MAKKQNEARKTSARLVMDVFHRRGAYSVETAIATSEFRNLHLTSAIISYTIGNLVNDGIVKKVNEDSFYFDKVGWRKMEKKVGRAYWILIGSPLIVFLLILLFRYWDEGIAVFFK